MTNSNTESKISRDKVVHVRFNSEELAGIQRIAGSLHISLSSTVRMLTLKNVAKDYPTNTLPWSTS